MIEMLKAYDWVNVFGYAGDPGGNDGDEYGSGPCTVDTSPNACVGSSADPGPVLRKDVKRVLAHSEGENDGPNWLIVVEMNDGRFAYLEAGCDFTGWDCQAGGSCTVATSLPELMQFGLTDEARQRLGAQLAAHAA